MQVPICMFHPVGSDYLGSHIQKSGESTPREHHSSVVTISETLFHLAIETSIEAYETCSSGALFKPKYSTNVSLQKKDYLQSVVFHQQAYTVLLRYHLKVVV